MADQVTPSFPAESIPTVFADTVMNLAHTTQVAKFYLARFDPSLNAPNESRTQTFAQVVMPMRGFLDAFAFFEQQVAYLIKKNIISQAQVDEARGNNPEIKV